MCDTCGSEIYQEVVGQEFMPKMSCPSQRCRDNKSKGKVNMQTRGSKFTKYQELRIQELPDQVPVGHIPRSITVQCRGEQARRCGPGDTITVSGIFLAQRFLGYKGLKAGLQSSTFIDACSIEKEKKTYTELTGNLDTKQRKEIQEISMRPNCYKSLASSIAPEIYGHDDVKRALLLQLVGGVTRALPDGMKIRGDINICLVGDPGVAKSQLLKYVSKVAPRGVYTTGKGSSGVGLTAAIVKDTLTGELSLEGGALVLADMGICCIDEFDKMEEGDRTAIHEVMEQQTISIAKAGITTTLNARTAVLAAANPLYGRYNKRKSISENVDLPNSLLSRFDLLYLLLDKANSDKDKALATHVLHVHKHLERPANVDAESLLPVETVKRYICAARELHPTIPRALTAYVVDNYVSLRGKDGQGVGHGHTARRNGSINQAVMTARQLLSILRLGQALARIRLANRVENDDIDEAIRLIDSSKASLHEENKTDHREDVTSQIYGIVRDEWLRKDPNAPALDYPRIETMVLHKGFSGDQLRSTLTEYESLGVITVDADRTQIVFE
jgi:DNA replication licensing factor MCM7